VSVHHEANSLTILANRSDQVLIWRASFQGSYRDILVDGQMMEAQQAADGAGNPISYVDIEVGGKKQVTAEVNTEKK